MLSIIIPSRQPEFLQKTIDDLLSKARGEVEVIVVYDGIWPEQVLNDDPRVIQVHHGEVHNNIGMRGSINAGMALASGDYVMKCDEHTMMGEGYDEILIADCEPDWVVVPRRKRLDPAKWELIEDGRPPVDYMYVEYPYAKPLDKTQGLHGAEDRQRYEENRNLMVDDLMTMQGSCYFMGKDYWDELFPDGLDDENYGPFTQEAQEISNKAWLSGGRVVVNKNTWYAHYHKGSKGKGYGFSNEQYKRHAELNEKGRLYCIDYWLHTTDYTHDFDWLLKRFWPVKGWGNDWQAKVEKDRKLDYSTTNYANDYWLEGLRK